MKKWLWFMVFSFPLILFAADSTFVEGNAYKVIGSGNKDKTKIEVIEFFNYGCPWCYRSEPAVEAFRKTLGKDVDFKRVSVPFNPQWAIYAKAFYTAQALGRENVITPAYFKALHDQKRSLVKEEDIEALFVANKVSASDFKSAFSFSPGIEAQLQQARDMVTQYQVTGVPAIVVDGKYLTNSLFAEGDPKKMVEITSYLIKKARKERRN